MIEVTTKGLCRAKGLLAAFKRSVPEKAERQPVWYWWPDISPRHVAVYNYLVVNSAVLPAL